jgi:hypothetical protein
MTEFGATGADATIRDINQVNQAVNRATGGFNLLGTAVGTAGGFLIGQAISRGIGMVTGLGSSIITTSAQAETLGLMLETAVGDRAKQVYADLQKFAALTPFEFPEIVQSTVLLENFGIKSNEVIKGVGRNWTEIIGDTASAMGKSYDEVTQAVTDAVMGEGERLKELGIRSTIEGDKIKYTYMKNGKEMTAFADRNSQEMIASTIAGIWNDKYEGAMEKQSRSFAGKMSTLRDNWSMTMQRMGEGVFDFAKVGLTHANLFFDRFNVGLDKGLSPFQAGARALKFTLQDIFGKGPVNKIWGGMEGMFGMIGTGGRKLLDVASGLKNVGFGIGAAFFEGDREQFFRQLPGWLQQSARYAGTVAEGFGDIYRAYRENGISGAIDSLFGSEGRQIVNAAVDLVVDAVPRFGAWLWDTGTDMASWLWSKIPGVSTPQVGDGTGGPEFDATTKPFTVPVLMDLAANFGKWIWGKGGDFAGWVLSFVPGTGRQGDGTGGPEFDSVGGVPQKLDVLFDLVAGFGKWVWGTTGDAASWIKNELPDLVVDNVEASLSFVSTWGGMAWGAYGDDFQGWFRASVGSLAATVDAAIGVNASEADKEAARQSGSETGQAWGEGFAEAALDPFSWARGGGGGGSDGPGSGFWSQVGYILTYDAEQWFYSTELGGRIKAIADNFVDAAVDEVVLSAKRFPVALRRDLGDIWSGVGDLFTGGSSGSQATGLFDEFGDQIFATGDSSGMFDGILADITGGFEIFIGDLTGSATDFKDDLGGLIKGAFDIDFGPIQEVVDGILAKIGGWIGDIKKLWADLQFWKDETEREQNGGMTNEQVQNAKNNPPGGVNYGFGGTNVGGNNFVHGSPWNTPGVIPEEGVIPARLDLDTSDAQAKLMALGVGGGSAKQAYGAGDGAFKATFELDTSEAQTKQAEAFIWGSTWAGSEYSSAFNINDSDAVAKKSAAFLSGMNWAGSVFTARFSVDISPLETALNRTREIAQEISDLLPRSPAKKGPLARPISFGYIGDALKSAMRGMARDAEVGMAALSGTLNGPVPATGRGRGSQGGGTTVNIITIPPDEWVSLARSVERGENIDLNLARELAVRKAKAVS